MAYGGVRGALAGLNHPWVEYVQPAVWRGSYGLGGGAAGKVAGIALARELLNDPERALTHDEADAVLLAWWGWRNVLNK
jgi:Holliday junction resolvasome RuvABC endonuclease subunit